MLRVRPRHLPRLHDVRPGRDPLSRPRRREARPGKKVVKNLQRSSAGRTGTVTLTLIAINVGIYFLQLAGGASINANSGWIYQHGALYGPLVAPATGTG